MPKVRITRTFSLPEERVELEQAMRLDAYLTVLAEFYQYLRDQEKYAEKPATLPEVREEFHRLCSDAGFDPLTGSP